MILYILFTIVEYCLNLLSTLMLISALLSWFPGMGNYRIVQVLNLITGTVAEPVRRLMRQLGLSGGPIDFSYLIAMVLVEILAVMAGQLASVFA